MSSQPLAPGGMVGMALWYKYWVLRNLSVLELDEVELADGVESDVRVRHHVSVLWCGIVVDGSEDRLCHVAHCDSGRCHLAVGGDAVEVSCRRDPISCY